MKAMMQAKTESGCGCNCGPGACDCRTTDASCGCEDGVLVRPQFFAGQLLTDDDLQALTNYIVNSRRLHNRFIVGNGVSCGLAVTCHPCGGGRVIVQPGHAVDCCGNEIMVPCPVELDINGMVRDLRFRKLGHDCGDPCPDPEKGNPNGKPVSNQEIDPVTSAVRPGIEKPKPDGKQYCLYVRYCETLEDHVAPYTQDDKCAVTCEPSRVNEGFRFELRCPTEEPAPPSIVDRIECCLGRLEEADRRASDFERVQYQARRAQLAQSAWDRGETVSFTDADQQLIIEGQSKLHPGTVFAEEERSPARAEVSEQPGEEAIRGALDRMFSVSSATARFYMQPEQRQNELLEQEDFATALETNRSILLKLAPELSERSQQALRSPIEQKAAKAVAEAALIYTDSDPDVDRQSISANYFAYNSVYDTNTYNEQSEALRKFKAWLLRKLDECPPTGQCCLEQEVAAIVIPTGDSTEALWSATEKLAITYLKFLLDCICSALLPPCPPCDDEAVKLACLAVVDCKVTNICNLERRFLLTENNLRYWIPFIHALGEALEKVCCEFPKNLRFRYQGRVPDNVQQPQQPQSLMAELKSEQRYFRSGQKAGDQLVSGDLYPNVLSLAGISPETLKASINVGSSLGRVASRDPSVAVVLDRADITAGRNLSGLFVDGIVERESTRAVLAEAAKKSVEEMETRVESLADEGMRMAEETETRFNERMANFESRLGDRLTARSVRSVKFIKDMNKKLEDVVAENRALIKRIEAIEKGASQ